jgi:hypothetical protein
MKTTVRPEPVEGPSFLSAQEQGQGFDKLSPNGFWEVIDGIA